MKTPFATKLRLARAALGMTTVEAARAWGTTRHQIRRWEDGTYYPSVLSLIGLSDAIGVSPVEMLEDIRDQEAAKRDLPAPAIPDDTYADPPRYRTPRWRPEEIALLGTAPDVEVAAQLPDRTVKAVQLKRASLGIRSAGRSNLDTPRWRPEEIALLGTAPDVEVAAQLPGRTVKAVRRKRGRMGIPRWSASVVVIPRVAVIERPRVAEKKDRPAPAHPSLPVYIVSFVGDDDEVRYLAVPRDGAPLQYWAGDRWCSTTRKHVGDPQATASAIFVEVGEVAAVVPV